jgi:general secretion pathway protein D
LGIAIPHALAQTEGEEETKHIKFGFGQDTPLVDIMEYVEIEIDRHFIYPEAFKSAKVNFSDAPDYPLIIYYREGKKAETLYNFFETILEIAPPGFALVDRGEVIEIVETGRRLQKPVRILSQEEAKSIPPTNTLVTLLYTFSNFDPGKLPNLINPLLNQQAEKVHPIQETQTIVLTAYASKLRELTKILELVDKASPKSIMEFIELKNARSEEVIPAIKEIIQSKQAYAKKSPETQQLPAPSIVADPRSNDRMIVIALPEEVREIRDLVSKLDNELPFGAGSKIRFFKIKYRDVSGGKDEGPSITDVLNDLFTARKEVAEQQTEGQPQGAKPKGDAAQQAQYEAPRIVPDVETNSLLVIAPTEAIFSEVEQAIAQLDRRKPQVFLEAVIMELGQDATRALGIELASLEHAKEGSVRGGALTNQGLSALSLGGTGQSASALPAGNTNDPHRIPLPPPAGSLTAFLFKDEFGHMPILMRLLQNDSDTNVLAVPRLLTNENKPAKFSISRQEPFQEGTTTTGIQTTSVKFAEAKTELNITPSVTVIEEAKEGQQGRYLVRLKVSQKIETFQGGAPFSGAPPPKGSREISTDEVTVPSGTTVMFGGFTSKNKRQSISKVPFLGDIPLLGFFFRSKESTDTYSTIFIFLSPHVITTDEQVTQVKEKMSSPEDLEKLKQEYGEIFKPVKVKKAKERRRRREEK